jgi:hypothetical protein
MSWWDNVCVCADFVMDMPHAKPTTEVRN